MRKDAKMNTDAIKLKLEARLAELNARAKKIEDDLSQPGDDDWAENATESEGDEVEEKVGSLAVAEMKQIDLALTQIDAGTFGKCTSCGIQINPKRLEAVPYATKCVNC